VDSVSILIASGGLIVSALLLWLLQRLSLSRNRALERAAALNDELRDSEQRYRTLASAIPVGVFRLDAEARCVYVNEAWCRICGMTPEEAKGHGWQEAIHPEDRPNVIQSWKQALATRSSVEGKYRILRPDHSVLWVYGQAARQIEPASKSAGFIGSITDISEIKRVQGHLERTVSMLQATMDATNDAILVTDPSGNMESCNQRLLDLYRTTRDVFSLPPDERLVIMSRSVRDPEGFLARARDIHQTPEEDSRDVIEMLDGRLIERVSRPQRISGRLVGRVWSMRDITNQAQADVALRRELQFRSELMEVIPNPVYIKDRDGHYLGVNRAWERCFGPRSMWLEKTLADIEPEEAVASRPREIALLESGGSAEYELRTVDINGQMHDLLDNLSVFRDERGRSAGIIGVLTDITERKQAESRLKESEEKFRLITENIGDLVALLDVDGQRLYNSPSYHALFGPAGEMSQDSFAEIHPEDRDRIRELFQETVRTGKGSMDQFRFIRPDGSVRFIESQGSVIHDEKGEVSKVIVVSRDITERKLSEEHIRHLAQHDVLTNLPNRMLLTDRIGQAIAQASRASKSVAVLFLDLDRFKTINDSLGHQMGDRVLLAVAKRLLEALREGDTVARLGGDEFVIALPEIGDTRDVGAVAEKVLKAIAQPLKIDQIELHVQVSIGVSLYPEDGQDADTLMRKADTAMYHAKSNGRNNYQFFTAEMNAAVHKRLALETGLRYAVARSEFLIHYQPQIELASGRVVSVEALVRWQHPTEGLQLPAEFIRVAEEIGLIIQLGEWVLTNACRQARAWQDQGYPPVRIAVNLSARQFTQKHLPEVIRRALNESGLEPHYLELELTETEMMQYATQTLSALHEINAMGVHISVDDFGTGYSSLSYIKQLPIDRLKIDQSFVRDIHTDPNDAAIVAAIIAMGHVLKLGVVAEGVESESQLNFLRLQTCDEAQGFFIARPGTAEEIGPLLGKRLPLHSESGDAGDSPTVRPISERTGS
jgi:diguanylate cyclase (GGDEF)-like protein/PAS domain S-box-containing protein